MRFASALLLTFGATLTMHAQAAQTVSMDDSATFGSLGVKDGYPSEQGAYAAYDATGNLALGKAVSVSDTIAGYASIHNAAFLTDGHYGNGSSWIANAELPTATIDLGAIYNVNALVFGRDRIGFFTDRSPGQFSIAVSADDLSYTTVLQSSELGFSGHLGTGQSVRSTLDAVQGRYVRLTLGSSGAAVDEIAVYGSAVTPVPEPSSIALVLAAAVPLLMRKRLRRQLVWGGIKDAG